jgi:acyl-CoA thioester hydrolase
MQKTVHYHHTSAFGCVSDVAIFEFLEEARKNFFADRGIEIADFIKQGEGFVIVKMQLQYQGYAFYGDTLDIDTQVQRIGRASLVFQHAISRSGVPLVEAEAVVVYVRNPNTALAIPEDFKKKLAQN